MNLDEMARELELRREQEWTLDGVVRSYMEWMEVKAPNHRVPFRTVSRPATLACGEID